jgi:hypothetical protein
MEPILNFHYDKGVQEVKPAHTAISSWVFTEDEHAEAILAQAMAVVAEKNGVGVNDLAHLFPAVLRMLKSEIDWSK